MDRSMRILLGGLVASVYALIFVLAGIVGGNVRLEALGSGLCLASILSAEAVDVVDFVNAKRRKK